MVIIGIVITMGFEFTQGYMERQRHVQTRAKLDAVEEALVTYVAQYRRLPCPADGVVGTGVENGSGSDVCADGQKNGVPPWRALGLPKDMVVDAWGNYLMYRVEDATPGAGATRDYKKCETISPARDEGMNLSHCDPTASPSDLTGRLSGVGFFIADKATGGTAIADPSEQNGAAYVLISHGPEGEGAVEAGGGKIGTGGATDDEKENFNADKSVSGTSPSPYIAAERGSFDDYVRYATIMQVAIRAGIGPH
jgi:type II secretory pathway pseudopilin PulG